MSKGGGGTPATTTSSIDIPPEFKAWIFGPGTYGRTAGTKGASAFGSAASGAASGAALGTQIMPGWGTAIGAIGGGVLGLLGRDKGDKGNPGQYYNPGFGGILPEAQQLAAQGMLDPAVLASLTTKEGLQAGKDYAANLQNNFLPQIQSLFDRVTTRDLVNDPITADAIAASTRPIQQQLDRYGVPMTQDAAIAAGQLGSSRQGIAEGLARSDANSQMGDIASRIAFGALQEQLAGERMGLQFSPQLMAMMGMPSDILTNIGQREEFYDQEQRQSQSNNLLMLANLLQGFIPGANQTTTSREKTNGLEGIASTGATLMELFKLFKG
jgi:hypothetical protein